MSWWARVAAAVRTDFSDLPDAGQAASLVIRLLMAALLGGALGYERKRAGKSAGIRTHMLVALGAALFVLIPQQAGAAPGDITRVLQGVVAGIGSPASCPSTFSGDEAPGRWTSCPGIGHEQSRFGLIDRFPA